jgi:hypothetical protein
MMVNIAPLKKLKNDGQTCSSESSKNDGQFALLKDLKNDGQFCSSEKPRK